MQYKVMNDYIEFNIAVNDTTGNGRTNPSGTFQVRKKFRPNSDAPVYDGFLSLLGHVDFPPGCMFAGFQITEANGFQYDTEYAVYCEVTADTSANPSGFIGEFKVMASGVANPSVPPSASDPGFITGYLYCYDEDGAVLQGVEITYLMVKPPPGGTGLGLDGDPTTVTSDVNGLVSIANLLPGAAYHFKRGTGKYDRILIPADAADPYALPDVLGPDD